MRPFDELPEESQREIEAFATRLRRQRLTTVAPVHELQEARSRLSRLEEAANDLCERAERARGILFAQGNWGMLDTRDLRAALSGDDSQQTAPSGVQACGAEFVTAVGSIVYCARDSGHSDPHQGVDMGRYQYEWGRSPDSATDSQPEGVMRNSGPNIHSPDVAVPEQENAEVRARTDNSVVRDVQPRAAGELVATGEALDGKPAATISAPAPASISEAERLLSAIRALVEAKQVGAIPKVVAAVIEEVRKLERFAQALETEARHDISILEQRCQKLADELQHANSHWKDEERRCQQLERERDEHEAQYLWRALQANETIASVREELAEAHKTATSERQQREQAEVLLHRWKAWYFSETDEEWLLIWIDQGWDIGDATKAYFGKREPSPASARSQRTGLE